MLIGVPDLDRRARLLIYQQAMEGSNSNAYLHLGLSVPPPLIGRADAVIEKRSQLLQLLAVFMPHASSKVRYVANSGLSNYEPD